MMAESSGDAIPIQNYQEDVVVVPIDVHQRHNCQVSQIFDPDKALKIAEAQPNNLIPKKTRTEYFREYKARKRIRIQSTSDTPSIALKKGDTLNAGGNLNNPFEFVALPCRDINTTRRKNNAEYMREYRARQKIRRQLTNGTSSGVHQKDNVLQADDILSNPFEFVGLPCRNVRVQRRKSTAEYMRVYRARKKICIQSTSDTPSFVIKEDSILQADNDLNNPIEGVKSPCQDIKALRRKTLAMYMREYRARKKNLNQSTSDPLVIPQQENDILQADDSNNVHKFVELPKPNSKVTRRKMRTEYMRGYRAQKKICIQPMSDTSSVAHLQEDDISSQTCDDPSNAHELVELSDQDINAVRQKRATESMREHIPVKLEPFQESQNQVPYLDESENATLLFNSDFHRHQLAHEEIKMEFVENPFNGVCSACNGLCFKYDLQPPSSEHEDILKIIVPHLDKDDILICNTCRQSLDTKNIRTMAVYNGFEFPRKLEHLPSLDLISERLISPRIPFMQIRRLRQVNGQYVIHGQVINVSDCIYTMVNSLLKNIADDHCINVDVKRKKIYKSSYLHGIVNKGTIKLWLKFLVKSPRYTTYYIKIDQFSFDGVNLEPKSYNSCCRFKR
ncbi:uncharacterized protein LOC103577701 [Microplitis demolitor]|uniref:uncharacterized protein LOC103577701 n=1 Tax=Microplitis demolitor TaxID=69319 RepID=UPI0004CCBED7|nr:uncharacterized protein LOC103577701 [Microplitis demolitor]XP_014297816.1 uncharacterized protein LOC103577701 [Microplitis demolitor]